MSRFVDRFAIWWLARRRRRRRPVVMNTVFSGGIRIEDTPNLVVRNNTFIP